MTGNCHVPCGVGEKLEITSNAYLLLTLVKHDHHFDGLFLRPKHQEDFGDTM